MQEELKKLYRTKKIDLDTYNIFLTIYDEFLNEFNFLVFSPNYWNGLMKKGIEIYLNQKERKVSFMGLRRILRGYVIDSINNLSFDSQVNVLYNYLIKLAREKNTYQKMLIRLMDFISQTKITFNQELFDDLNKNSKYFKAATKSFGIRTVQDLKDLSNGVYDNYIKFKAYDKDIKWTADRVKYIKSLMKRKVSISNPTAEDSKIINYIITNYSYIDKIYDLYVANVKKCARLVFDEAIFNYTYRSLENLIHDYKEYAVYKDKKYLAFLSSIFSNKHLFQVPKVEEKENKFNKLYNLFPNYGLTEEDKIVIISDIYHDLFSQDKRLIETYLSDTMADNKVTRDALCFIKGYMFLKYKSRLVGMINVSDILPDNKELVLTDFFPNGSEVDAKKKEMVIEELLSRESKANQDLVRKYFTSIITREEKAIVVDVLERLQRHYIYYLKSGHLPKMEVKSIYECMPNVPNIKNDEKNQLVNYILNLFFSKESIENIFKYFDNDFANKGLEVDRQKATVDIEQVRIYYLSIKRNQLLPLPTELKNAVSLLNLKIDKINKYLISADPKFLRKLDNDLANVRLDYLKKGTSSDEYWKMLSEKLNAIAIANPKYNLGDILSECLYNVGGLSLKRKNKNY